MTVMMSSGAALAVGVNHTINASDTMMAARLIRLRYGSISGADLILAESLRNATIEPVSVTAPMNTPRNTSPLWT